MNTFLLDLLAFGAIVSGVLVITSKNPVFSILFLISVFLNAAGYLILLGVGFVGISYLIVYVGRIAILFLFVVMMLNISLSEIVSVGSDYTKNIPLGFIVGSLFLVEILSLVPSSFKEAGNFRVNAMNYRNGLILGIDSSSVGNNVHLMYSDARADERFSNFMQIESIAQNMYGYGSMWLLLSSIVLLLRMMGPIVLCLRVK